MVCEPSLFYYMCGIVILVVVGKFYLKQQHDNICLLYQTSLCIIRYCANELTYVLFLLPYYCYCVLYYPILLYYSDDLTCGMANSPRRCWAYVTLLLYGSWRRKAWRFKHGNDNIDGEAYYWQIPACVCEEDVVWGFFKQALSVCVCVVYIL